MNGAEKIAVLLWERFSPDHEVEWPSIHAAEYRMAANDILEILESGDTDEQEVRRKEFSSKGISQ